MPRLASALYGIALVIVRERGTARRALLAAAGFEARSRLLLGRRL